jgi:hypothetical protein
MDFVIRFSEEKNELLKSTRSISFEEILVLIHEGNILDDLRHPDPGRSTQRIYLVKIQKYVYVVPYVINNRKQEIFLKTAYPSRKYTKIYMKGEKS